MELPCDAIVFVSHHNGVGEETAGVSQHFRVGQLTLANSNNGGAQQGGIELVGFYSVLRQRQSQSAVSEVRFEVAAEAEADVGDGVAAAQAGLEDTVAVGVLTFVVGELSRCSCLKVNGFYE